jgi:hypothetical protein
MTEILDIPQSVYRNGSRPTDPGTEIVLVPKQRVRQQPRRQSIQAEHPAAFAEIETPGLASPKEAHTPNESEEITIEIRPEDVIIDTDASKPPKEPWKYYRPNKAGIIDIFKKPRMPLRRKIGAAAAAGFFLLAGSIKADVVYSEMTTVHVEPRVVSALGSIPCKGARAMATVFAGYGIDNSENTAQNIATIANQRGICTVSVHNGTNVNIPAVSEAVVAEAEANGVDTIIPVGESVGGDEAVLMTNYVAEKYGDKYKIPGLLADSSPDGKQTLKWINPTVAEIVAEYCDIAEIGDWYTTLITLLTDQNEERRNNFIKYFDQVYSATHESPMSLRGDQSCMAGKGIPQMNKVTDTHVFYVRNGTSHGDPIVDVDLSQNGFEEKSNGLFHAIHMVNVGTLHASPWEWDKWPIYEPYYRKVFARIDAIMIEREQTTWYKNPYLPQPR